MKAKRTSKISIRTRPDILEAADNLKATNGYSRADIFEMGVLLLESNNDSSLILQNKIYSEMVTRFENLSEKVHKECENIQSNILKELNSLKVKSDEHNIDITKKSEVIEENIQNAVEKVMTIVKLREENMKYPQHARRVFEPLGKEYYLLVAEENNIPYDVLVAELEKLGYNSDVLLDLGMNPLRNYTGERELSKSTIM